MKQVPDSLLAFQHMFPDDDEIEEAAERIGAAIARALRLRLGRGNG